MSLCQTMCGGKNVDGPAPKQANNTEPQPTISKSNNLPRRLPTKKFLDAILANKELTSALENFLQSEFCLENLLFLQKCGAYRELYEKVNIDKQEDRVKLGELRDEIQKEFMLPTSEKEVNIPAKIKRECLINIETLKAKGLKMEAEEYETIAAQLFSSCENHVKTVLVQERIGRFQATDAFAKVATQLPPI